MHGQQWRRKHGAWRSGRGRRIVCTVAAAVNGTRQRQKVQFIFLARSQLIKLNREEEQADRCQRWLKELLPLPVSSCAFASTPTELQIG